MQINYITLHLRKNKIYIIWNITAEVIIFSIKFKLYHLSATYSTYSVAGRSYFDWHVWELPHISAEVPHCHACPQA